MYQPPPLELIDTWPNILWREQYFCRDEVYAGYLERLLADVKVGWGLRWRGRPAATEVELAIRQACQALSILTIQEAWLELLEQATEAGRKPQRLNQLLADLEGADWRNRFIARHGLARLGGEAVPSLISIADNPENPLRSTANWILKSIEFETTARLFPQMGRLVCPRCLVRCHANWAEERLNQLLSVHYGCRACGQSREFLEWTGKIVTVLDRAMAEKYTIQADTLRGNWLAYRSLFDCHWVEIIQASDEEIEYFAVQVGNDTDELRQPFYRQMRCLLGPECRPSENTLRILQHQFGQVERQ